tara:strand:+ start:253 stop:690 length:438 start_codon:yes stop_codon:yes gene_type:complete
MRKIFIIWILICLMKIYGQSSNPNLPSEFWLNLSDPEKLSFVNGAYGAISLLKKSHRDEVAKQYLHDKNWIQPYYIERFYNIADEYVSEEAGYNLSIIIMHMDALYANSDNQKIPVLEAMRVVSLMQDGLSEKANFRLLQLQRKY